MDTLTKLENFSFFRCALNMTEEQRDSVSTAMEFFLDSLPGSSIDTPIFMEVTFTGKNISK